MQKIASVLQRQRLGLTFTGLDSGEFSNLLFALTEAVNRERNRDYYRTPIASMGVGKNVGYDEQHETVEKGKIGAMVMTAPETESHLTGDPPQGDSM